jgi:hypothetical protein
LTNRLKEEAGYSLVEVMVSILLLSIAIIPMVGMFDAGLKTATTGSNYDKARAFANERLERTKVLSYTQVRDVFPYESPGNPPPTPPPRPSGTTGVYTSTILDIPANVKLPNGTYTVRKEYVSVNPSGNLANSGTGSDTRLIRVTIKVNWSSSNSINVSGVVAGGVS